MFDNLIQIPNNYIKEKNTFKLNNGLNVIRYNIRNTNKKGCFLRVKTGAFFEKVDGLAHLVEHCVLNRKEYIDIINKLNGFSNGSTDIIYTNYLFYINKNKENIKKKEINKDEIGDNNIIKDDNDIKDVDIIKDNDNDINDNKDINYDNNNDMNDDNDENEEDDKEFKECLKEFSKIFYDYRIDEEIIKKEIKIIDIEFMSKKKGDDYTIIRNNLKNKEICGTGIKETLDIENIKDRLYDFINYFYYAENMDLIIFDDDKIENIKEKVKCFENIKQNNNEWRMKSEYKNIKEEEIEQRIKPNQLYKINIDIEKQIKIYYCINKEIFNKNVYYYLKFLINNYLINYLIEKKLIIGGKFEYNDYSYKNEIIFIKFKLTDEGYNKYNYIINIYCKFLNYVIENIRKINFKKIIDICFIKNYYYKYSTNIKNIMENIINYNKYLKDYYDFDNNFNFNIFETFIKNQLNINNSLIIINNPDFKDLNEKYKYYDLKYIKEEYKIKEEEIEDFNFDFTIKLCNEDLTFKKLKNIKIKKEKYRKLIDEDKYKLYFDSRINKKKCNIYIKLELNNLNLNDYIYIKIYCRILNDYFMNSFFKFDKFYGLYCNFSLKKNFDKNYLHITIHSIIYNINKLLFVILNNLLNYKFNEQTFNTFKLLYKNLLSFNYYNNFSIYDNINDNLKKLINNNYYTKKDILNNIDNIKYDNSFKLKFYKLESLIYCSHLKSINKLKDILINFSENNLLNEQKKDNYIININLLNNKIINIDNKIQKLTYSKNLLFNLSNFDQLTKYKYTLSFNIIQLLLYNTFWNYIRNLYPSYGEYFLFFNINNNICNFQFTVQVNKDISIDNYNIIVNSIDNYINHFLIDFIKNNISDNIIHLCINNYINKHLLFDYDFNIFLDNNYYSSNIKIINSITKNDLLNCINYFILNKNYVNCIFNINNNLF